MAMKSKTDEVKKSNRKLRLGIIIAAAVLLLVLAGATTMGFLAQGVTTIFPNLSIMGIDVSGMTAEEASAALEEAGFHIEETRILDITLTDKVSITVTGADVGYAVTVPDAVQKAVDYGTKAGFFGDGFRYLRCLVSSVDIDPTKGTDYDETVARAFVDSAVNSVNAEKLDTDYEVTEDKLIVTKGITGIAVNTDEIYALVENAFKNEDFTPVTYTPQTTASGGIDFQAIYNNIFVEPVSAVYDPETMAATEDTMGVSFDVAGAQKLYDAAEEGEEIQIPLILTEPEITTEALNAVLFADVLYSKSTTMYTSSSARLNNVTLAAKAVNGTVLNPGDTFSFNEVVGQRTAAKGYQAASAYVGGETVDTIGGGICQVSSTLYYCVLYSNLEVVDRSNHMFSVSYLPLGTDATVSWPNLDFKFRNNTDYPIKISAYVQSSVLYVTFYGTKVDDSYVSIYSSTISSTPFDTIEKEDPSIAPGTTEVKTTGYTGYVVDVYKYVYAGDGTLLESVYLGRDVYNKRDKVVLIPVTVTPPPEVSTPPDPGTSESTSPSASPAA